MNEMEQDSDSPAPKRAKLEDNGNDEQAKSSSTNPLENSKYDNYVNPEELERLKEFKVLDEVKSNDEDSNDEDSESSEGGVVSEKSEGLPEEEIERMLEEDLPEGFKGAPKPKERPFVTRQKVVLEEKGVNHFEVLPLDWMMVRHYSGMPVYMHRTTRVCTLSKPYFLGKGNTRRHEIPISAIPCYAYRRALEEETKQKEIDKKIEEQIKNTRANGIATNLPESKEDKASQLDNSETKHDNGEKINCPYRKDVPVNGVNDDCGSGPKVDDKKKDAENGPIELGNLDGNVDDKTETDDQTKDKEKDKEKEKVEGGEVQVPRNRQPVILPGGIVMPPPRVETVNTSWKTQHLTHEQVNNYCKKLFKFKTVHIMHFERWADRRKYNKARKTLQYPTLPEGTKLITIPATPNGTDNGGKSNKRDWVMNMNGRSYLSVFHEYVRRALQKQPVYEFVQLENASTPYQATVYIGGMQYGVGHGSSKRQAKSAAARASIHILIPEMKDELDSHAPHAAAAASTDPDFSFFDYVTIEDPRITEFCAATCEPSPHAILRTCLLRNFGAGDRHIHTEMKKLEFQKIELTMKVGKHSATVVCKNKKTAKQRASQAILQALHPHVRSWGSLLRLYGSRSVKSCKEKKLEEQQITLLQDKARHNEPNYAVLAKLKHEMAKLREQDASVVPIGTLMLQEDLPTHSGANLNNVDL